MSHQSPPVPRANRTQRLSLFLVVVALPLVFTPSSAAPFADAKLLMLVGGATLLGFARLRVDPVVFTASAVWVFAITLAALLGRDPGFSLMGAENQSTGVVTLLASAFLLCAGTSIDEPLRARVPVWLFWTGTLVAAVAVLGRFVDLGGVSSQVLTSTNSTLGHRVFVGGFISAALIAATVIRRTTLIYGGVVVLASGLAVTAARSAWIGLALGLVVVAWNRWTSVLHVVIPVVLVLAGWTIVDRSVRGTELEVSAVPRFTQVQEGSAAQRLPALRANVRAWVDDPLLGSGPATGGYGFLSHATAAEVRKAERAYGDAHNLPVELAATTGVVGVLATALLAIAGLARTRRSPPDRRWGLGIAVALVVVHQFQPLNVVLTPLMFLAAGLAVPLPSKRPQIHVGRWAGVLLSCGLVLAGMRMTASLLEKNGATYASESAFRWALRIEPWRVPSGQLLAEHLAFDHLNGDRSAAADARRLVRQNVRRHGWSPSARLSAANVESILGNDDAAVRWLDEDLAIFPNDPLALVGRAVLAARHGNYRRAELFARRALESNPNLALAQRVLKDARQHTRR